jgi:predicted DCC family thiol-disulfide oxidoreductase YuxK
MSTPTTTRALYNGDCPVCNSEMGVYAAYAERTALPIAFDDLNRCDLARWGVSEDAAARLLHVLHEGRLYVGFDAFLVLWDQMPRYRWLARIGRVPGLYHLLSWGYAHIVARVIYARHTRRRRARRTKRV